MTAGNVADFDPDRVLARLTVSYARRFERELVLPGAGRGAPEPMPRGLGGLFGGGRRTSVSGIGRYLRWRQHADSVGFPTAGMAMTLEVTPDELVVHRASFVRGRPLARAGGVPLDRIAQVSVTRSLTTARIIFVFQEATLVTVESMSVRRARRFVDVLREASAAAQRRPRPS